MGRERKEIEEFGYDILNAVISGEITARDAQTIWNKSLTSLSDHTKEKYRAKFREILGVDDPITSSFTGIVELMRRRRLSAATTMDMLRPDRPSPSDWGDKISEGQKRSWASGKRKPLPEDHGERISRGIIDSRERYEE